MKARHLRSLRRLVQALSLLAIIYIIWQTRYPLRGFINPLVYFQLDPLVMGVAAIAERALFAGLLVSLVTIAVTLLFGRVFCGWFCPFGAVIDIGGRLLKVFRRRGREGEPGAGPAAKYWVLAGILLFSLAGVQLAWVLDPFSIFVRTFSFSIHPFLNNSVDRGFVAVFEHIGSTAWLENFYYTLKESVLAANNPSFPNTFPIFLLFAGILGLAAVRRRFWCRYLCPLGAVLALTARFTPLRRKVEDCKNGCSLCKATCRMNAIRGDNTYRAGECILCMDCVASCPGNSSFSFRDRKAAGPEKKAESNGISRSQFLWFLGGTLAAFFAGTRRAVAAGAGRSSAKVLRPPAALPERQFVQRCVRCGNCMKVCLTNVLQPSVFEGGWEGVWTPKVDTNVSYCEYQCTLCGQVCPTHAIAQLTVEEKMRTKIGLAEVDRSLCIPWAEEDECLVCEEHCPVSSKAIKMTEYRRKDGKIIHRPVVDPSLCVGCAVCQTKCPLTPKKGIRVHPL